MGKLKFFVISVLVLSGVITVGFCVKKPAMHKPLQINVIEKFIKINTDGSVTTTTSVTTNGVKEKNK